MHAIEHYVACVCVPVPVCSCKDLVESVDTYKSTNAYVQTYARTHTQTHIRCVLVILPDINCTLPRKPGMEAKKGVHVLLSW